MATILCKDFTNYLEPWTEGDRHPDALAHVRDCPRCRSLVEDLKMIQSSAQEWGSADCDPPPHLWNSLRVQLLQEGLIRQQSKRPGWLSGWLPALPRPALAGAYLAILIAVAFGLSGPVNQRINRARWLEGTENSTMPLRAQFASAQRNAMVSQASDSNPIVTASLNKNLAIVDNYITLCEKSVKEEPENELARDYLYDAYQQKADLLAQMSERGGYGR
ncbi:MAG: hypothetical protein ACRD5M_10840 [Candidatus Acidiferrales bacterium]